MNKQIRILLTFIITSIVTYLIVGYISNNVFVQIHWDENAMFSDKLREYYIRTFSINIIPTLILATISTTLFAKKMKN
ncbi:hypothetical protein JHL18_16040 [Clostridium sp. YIM B02505]|uniref:Uncharacterized protein n=1 Tax=Clostridium yunnanense TaxID=2800325 RepID=A0ABS1ERZ5_9CLOT|nr:hypothetical protein [Clostridium yunnanense]MBK1812134.1 hypothetical protein [Clostridium yunnanense]